MKDLICVVCKCTINPNAGYYNFSTGARCSNCGKALSKELEKRLKADPFGLKAAARLNRLRNQPKKR